MKPWETLTMSRKEVPRAGLLSMVLAGKVTNAQGAAALRVSPRHVQRLKARFQAEGVPGLLHRGRGRPSPRGSRRTKRWRAGSKISHGVGVLPP